MLYPSNSPLGMVWCLEKCFSKVRCAQLYGWPTCKQGPRQWRVSSPSWGCGPACVQVWPASFPSICTARAVNWGVQNGIVYYTFFWCTWWSHNNIQRKTGPVTTTVTWRLFFFFFFVIAVRGPIINQPQPRITASANCFQTCKKKNGGYWSWTLKLMLHRVTAVLGV